jgi:hypothetical protein
LIGLNLVPKYLFYEHSLELPNHLVHLYLSSTLIACAAKMNAHQHPPTLSYPYPPGVSLGPAGASAFTFLIVAKS